MHEVINSGGAGDRTRLQITCHGGKTKQSFKDECDINKILEKWQRTGELEHLEHHSPTYGDFTNADDFIAAHNQVIKATDDFNALSARIRDRMGNDPAKFLAFMGDPDNHDEAVSLGLISKPADPASVPPPVTDPVTSADSPPAPASGSTPEAGGE